MNFDDFKGNIRVLQMGIYTRKFFRTLRKESLISIIIGIIITVLVMMVTKKNMFERYEGTKSGFFSLICACIWIGIFNSIQLVCREKNDIVKDELDKSLHASSYMAAHFIYQLGVCIIQSIIIFIIFWFFVSEGRYCEGNPIAYLITVFLIIYASDAMAFVVSSAVPSPIVAMTVMPLILLIQLVMAGVLFELEGFAEGVSYFTVSKWGMAAFGMIGEICDGKMPTKVYEELTAKNIPNVELEYPKNDMDAYCGSAGEIFLTWLILVLFIVAFFALSVIALKLTTKKLKK